MNQFNPYNNPNDQANDRKNLIVFMIVVFALFALYDVFIKKPYVDKLREAQQQEMAQNPQPNIAEEDNAIKPRAEILAGSAKRIEIRSNELSGSIDLKGGRIDDLILNNYFKTLDKQENVVLLSPARSEFPQYGEFGWISNDQNIKTPSRSTEWSVQGNNVLTPETTVTLTWNNGSGLTFIRTISMDDQYMFTINQSVQNNSKNDVNLFPYAIAAQHGEPTEKSKAVILHEGPIGYFNTELQELSYKKLTKQTQLESLSMGGWVGFTQKYWFTGIIPEQDMQVKYRFLAQPGKERTHYQADIMGPSLTIPAGGSENFTTHFFSGAKKVRQLANYEENLSIHHFDLVVDFGMFYFLTKPFYYGLTWISKNIGSFALGLILFTVLIRLVLFPLANKSYRSFAKMRLVAPQMKELQERYKDDREGMQKALFELYKKEDVNPAAGCFPILLQIPIFFALYKVLYISIEMRHTPFFGWVTDMSAPDPTSLFNLFGLIPWDPPSFLMIGAWPCIMCISLMLQQKLSPPPTDQMQKTIMGMMPFFMTFILAGFPAGLVIYWTWSNILSIVQQAVLMKSMGVEINFFDNLLGRTKENPDADEVIDAEAEDVTEEKTEAEKPVPVSAPKRRRKKKK